MAHASLMLLIAGHASSRAVNIRGRSIRILSLRSNFKVERTQVFTEKQTASSKLTTCRTIVARRDGEVVSDIAAFAFTIPVPITLAEAISLIVPVGKGEDWLTCCLHCFASPSFDRPL
jgi:hypothetical protein